MITQLNKASVYSFEILFPILPSGISGVDIPKELTLNIHASIIPGVTLEVLEVPWMGGKAKMEVAGIDYSDWTFDYTVDAEFKNWKTMFKWVSLINNNRDRIGALPKEAYACDCIMRMLNNFKQEIFSLRFVNAWPSNLGDVMVEYRDGEMQLESNMLLTYDRYELASDMS